MYAHCTHVDFVFQTSSPITMELDNVIPPRSKSSKNAQAHSKGPSVMQFKNQGINASNRLMDVCVVDGIQINLDKLRAILKGYGEYPSKYR